MNYSRERKIKAFTENDVITNKNKTLHTEEEIKFLIEYLNDPGPTKNFFYYLEYISFHTCIYGIWDHNCENTGDDKWFKLAQKTTKNSLELMHVSNNIDTFNNYITDSDIDRLLERACETNKSILVVSTPGTVFHDKTALTAVWPYFEQNKNILMMGQVLDNNARKDDAEYYWSIHPQFFAINLELYKQLGRPKFNKMTSSEFSMGQRSEENFHDNYTPLWIKPNDSRVTKELKCGYGSNIINEALKNNCDIVNVPTVVRQNKKFYYPEKDETMVLLETENDLVLGNFHGGWNFVYIFNTEDYPKNFVDPCIVTVWNNGEFKNRTYNNMKEFIDQHTVDSFVNVSSGWVGDWWSYLFKFDQNKICYYDINSASLFYKKMLIENWPGPKHIPLGDFLYQHGDVKNSNMFFNLINLQRPKDLEKWRDDLNNYCQTIMNVWGEDEFQIHFEKVKRARQFYICTDLVHAPRSVENFDLVRKDNYQLIFASNILDNRVLFYQNQFNKEKIYKSVSDFFDRLPLKTIYIGNNITGLHNTFYDRKSRVTNILIKE
jgi:hypothetical protein